MMTCGLIRLICEDPQDPPTRARFVDVPPWRAGIAMALLRIRGWRVVSRWPL
jgi:hypothetical protein